MLFIEKAWQDNQHIYKKILAMPFNQELKNGTLRQDIFRDYMIQDAHYLEGFSRCLAAAAAKAQTTEQMAILSSSSYGAIIEEHSLHQTYLKEFSISEEEYNNTEPSPICELYISYLTKLAYQAPFEVALAGLLPCFHIYYEVGLWMAKNPTENNPYQGWVDAYSGAEFEESVQKAITIINDAANRASPDIVDKMHQAYTKASKLEWMFWDSAYRQAQWPL